MLITEMRYLSLGRQFTTALDAMRVPRKMRD
jgi:hypothetical protein